ncbi:MAG: PCYCGC domain-containing protein [Acidobacteriota bacterium]|nr:PCYCGC domain-containing protein [Acidobacteriota bacterium]
MKRMFPMKRIYGALFVALFAVTTSAQWMDDTPAFHTGPPPKGEKLAPILRPDQVTGQGVQYPYQKHAYVLASKVDKVIYQQPCYCHCDKGHGHTSLRTCFESIHGAHCGICLKEAVYTYQQSKKGKTAAQIRQGIMNKDYENVNLETSSAIQ